MAGQTLSEIRQLLAAANLAPRHRFGQNFLIDLNLMRKIVAAADLQADDVVLEVGPGTGSLTELLLASGARVVAVEVDRGLHALLCDRLGDEERLTLLLTDVLSGQNSIAPAVLRTLQGQQRGSAGYHKLVANLPYQVASPLLVELLVGTPRLERLVCTIQKEVADRLTAPSNTSAYGPLSVIVQTLARISVLDVIPPTAFWPAPKVDSASVALYPFAEGDVPVDDVPGFLAFVHRGFGQRRKMLRRFLREVGIDEGTAAQLGIEPNQRPVELAPADWQRLFRLR